MNNFLKTVEKLKSKGSNKKEPTLENTEKALESLGNPQEDYKVILIGGTNGKGSTTEIVSEILSKQGKKVGTFKSPHLKTLRERIKVNNQKISEKELSETYQELEKLDLSLSFFEFLTVTAYHYFSEKNIDYAIMEVGMGGKLDATNAAEPELSVITNVEKEHTQYLGETLEEIGEEIAGITPEKGKIVTGEKLESIELIAKKNAEIIPRVEISQEDKRYEYQDQTFSIPLNGDFQKENLETGLTVVKELTGIPKDIEQSLSSLNCPGRMERVNKNPEVILDGAHNPPAVKKVIDDLPEDFICIFGCVKTKDKEEMIKLLEDKASEFYFTKPDIGRAEKPENLVKYTKNPTKVFADNREAVEKALEKDQKTVVIGSLYLIGNIKEKMRF